MLDAITAVVGSATVLELILVFALFLRLRAREIETIFNLGCRQGTVARLLSAEVAIVVAASAAVCLAVWLLARREASALVQWLISG